MSTTDRLAANPRNVVVCGNARFTWLTSRMVRLEYAEDGQFEDRATFAVLYRNTPDVAFSNRQVGETLVLQSDVLTVRYRNDGKPFSRRNLSTRFVFGGKTVVWYPGLKDAGNLKGTARTLDGYDGERMAFGQGGRLAIGEGLISRSGWALVDDSASVVMGQASAGDEWVAVRSEGKRQDFYFLAYGHEYKQALGDFSRISGRQHLPPRFVFGMWWTRYWAYLDKEFETLVQDFDRNEVPLDVMVIDMDWHLPGWTGYTWDKRHFPDPAETLAWLKEQGLKVSLNIHPAEGVGRHEEMFERIARRMGRDGRKTERIEFNCTDPAFMHAYFEELHHPHEQKGVDFWWIDWQQGTKCQLEGLDPLPWLNHLHARDLEKRGKRPLIVSRYGGLGGGRFPVGFSGDALGTWDTLALEAWFTAMASNVLFGYWSHDIGGIFPTDRSPELFTRWVQYGAFSPVLRTHVAKSPTGERRVWEYAEPYFRAMRAAIAGRYEMVPYIYTECRKARETGISLCRPMYYDYPEEKEAYSHKFQYQFGDSMVVAPVVRKGDERTGLTEVEVWLPAGGNWFDMARGERLKGGAAYKRRYSLSEVPVFVREGAILPGQTGCRRLEEGSYKDLLVTVAPGEQGEYLLYEDDGISLDYLDGKCAWIRLSHSSVGGNRRVQVHAAKGVYAGFEKRRSLEIRLPGSVPADSVRAGGRLLEWKYRLDEEGWTYDGDAATLIIRIKEFDVNKGIKVDVKPAAGVGERVVDGFKGAMTRMKLLMDLSRLVMDNWPLDPRERLVADLCQTGNRIARNPATVKAEVARMKREMKGLEPLFKALLKALQKGDKEEWKKEAARNALLFLKQMNPSL